MKLTADGEGNVSITLEEKNTSKLFAEFGCIVLAFMRTMQDQGVKHVAVRTINMVATAANQFNKGGD